MKNYQGTLLGGVVLVGLGIKDLLGWTSRGPVGESAGGFILYGIAPLAIGIVLLAYGTRQYVRHIAREQDDAGAEPAVAPDQTR